MHYNNAIYTDAVHNAMTHLFECHALPICQEENQKYNGSIAFDVSKLINTLVESDDDEDLCAMENAGVSNTYHNLRCGARQINAAPYKLCGCWNAPLNLILPIKYSFDSICIARLLVS